MKFTKEKVSRLTGETEVVFAAQDVRHNNPCTFQVIAGPGGIRFAGTTHDIQDILDLSDFAAVIDAAYKEYLKLKPKIESPGSFRVQ
jgi:hypothetical protein